MTEESLLVGRLAVSRLFAKVAIKQIKKKSKKKKPFSQNQTKRNLNQKFVLGLFALGTLCLILLIGKLFTFLTSLYNPLTPEYQSKKSFRWEGKTTFNLAVKGVSLGVLSFNPVDNSLTVIKIPDNSLMEVPKGYGSWPARSIFELGQSETLPIGDKLVKSSLESLLGTPIDGFLTLENKNSEKSLDALVEDIHKNPFSILSFFWSVKSDLTGIELLNLAQRVAGTRGDKVTIVDLEDSSITKSELLADSTRVLGVDKVELDLYIRKNLKEAIMSNFDGSIAVYNATSHPGLASEVARIITNMGGTVITVSNTESNIEKTLVIYSNEEAESEEVLVRLKQIFSPECLRRKCSSNDQKILTSRASINIVLGEDYYLRKTDRNYSF